MQDFNRVLQLQPSNTDALYYRGNAFERQGLLDSAITDYSAVLAVDPNHVSASYSRACCRNRKGQLFEAVGTYAAPHLACSRTARPAKRHAGRGGGQGVLFSQ